MRTIVVAALSLGAGLLLGSVLWDGPPGATAVKPAGSSLPSGAAPELTDGGVSDDGTDAYEDAAEAGPASEPGLTPAGRPRGVLSDRALRAWALDLVNDAYAEYRREKGVALPEDLHSAAAANALHHLREAASRFGSWMPGYIDRRLAMGTLGDPPVIRVQARGTGSLSTSYVRPALREKLSRTPLDLENLEPADTGFEAYLDSGVVPLDRVLVIERIDVSFRIGTRLRDPAKPWLGKGLLDVKVDGMDALKREERDGDVTRGSLHGLAVFRGPGRMPDLRVRVRSAAVDLAARGRYVSFDDAKELRRTRFRWVTEGDDGLLGSEPVLLQVLADHGGGNPRVVRLDGTKNMYVAATAEANLWDADLDLRLNRRSLVWTENTGIVPEGKIYRITRIDWRARLDPKKSSHSDFIVRFQGKVLVSKKAPDGFDVSGTWTGEIDVRPDEERRFELECSYYSMGEAILHGSLVDPPKAPGIPGR